MCTAGFGEPLAYSRRVRQLLAQRRGDFDVVHDNQCLGKGMLGMVDDGWPLLTTLHHPITVDRELALAHATNPWQRLTQRRWFGFLGMQVRVARAAARGGNRVGEFAEGHRGPAGCGTRADDGRARRRGPHGVPPA